ncbi:hypothetical protein PMIN06_005950 [Paraphaeosphaeria minitans]
MTWHYIHALIEMRIISTTMIDQDSLKTDERASWKEHHMLLGLTLTWMRMEDGLKPSLVPPPPPNHQARAHADRFARGNSASSSRSPRFDTRRSCRADEASRAAADERVLDCGQGESRKEEGCPLSGTAI